MADNHRKHMLQPDQERRPEELDHVLLLSGGVDSAAVLASRHITKCVFVDYGQPSFHEERVAADKLANRFDLPLYFFKIDGVLLASMADDAGKPGARFVQARNALLMAAAANVVEPPGGFVYIGAHKGDHEEYPDCRPLFIDAFGMAMTYGYGIHVSAPLVLKTKEEVLEILRKHLPDWAAFCWSCYTPLALGEACGSCNSCQQYEGGAG